MDSAPLAVLSSIGVNPARMPMSTAQAVTSKGFTLVRLVLPLPSAHKRRASQGPSVHSALPGGEWAYK